MCRRDGRVCDGSGGGGGRERGEKYTYIVWKLGSGESEVVLNEVRKGSLLYICVTALHAVSIMTSIALSVHCVLSFLSQRMSLRSVTEMPRLWMTFISDSSS